MRACCFQKNAEGIRLFIKLTPKASLDEVQSVEEAADGPVLKAKVRAIPDKGKANKALIKLIAKWLGVAKSDISLKSGSKSRLKTLAIMGNPDDLGHTLQEKTDQL